MKMLFLVTDSEYEPHCMTTLKEKGVAGYTVIPDVFGAGQSGLKMGDRVHPGASVFNSPSSTESAATKPAPYTDPFFRLWRRGSASPNCRLSSMVLWSGGVPPPVGAGTAPLRHIRRCTVNREMRPRRPAPVRGRRRVSIINWGLPLARKFHTVLSGEATLCA